MRIDEGENVLSSAFLMIVMHVSVNGQSLCTDAPPRPVAPAPRILYDRPHPEDWKLGELNALYPNAEDTGPVAILVWEKIDFAGVTSGVERCLVVKRCAKPNGRDTYALGYFLRRPGTEQSEWKAWSLYLTGTKPGQPDQIQAVRFCTKQLPTDESVAAFLRELAWEALIRPGECTRRARRWSAASRRVNPDSYRWRHLPGRMEKGF